MTTFRFVLQTATLVVSVISLTGCGSSNRESVKDDLQALGYVYHAFHDSQKRGPDSADELINSLPDGKRGSFASSEAGKALKNGDFVLNPRLQFSKLKSLDTNYIIYEKRVTTGKGFVVLGHGSVKEMTSVEFAALDQGDEARAEKQEVFESK